MKKLLPIFIVVIVVVVGGSFYAGIQYNKSKSRARLSSEDRQMRGQQFGSGVRSGTRVGGGNGGPVAGEILSKDDKSITVKLRDGGSKLVFFSETTQVMKTGEGSVNDLALGQQITVIGDANADGSVNANTVQIRPEIPAARKVE